MNFYFRLELRGLNTARAHLSLFYYPVKKDPKHKQNEEKYINITSVLDDIT